MDRRPSPPRPPGEGGGAAGQVPARRTWPAGGGMMRALMRERDWSASPLGAPETWSQSLWTTVGLILPAQSQIVLFWGEAFCALYNDAYAPTIGDKHPRVLGRPAREGWAELWDDLGPLLRGVRETGETFSAKDRPFYIERHGYGETVYFDVSYSAVPEADGSVAGVLCIVSETTGRVLAERRQAFLLALSDALRPLGDAAEVQLTACRVLGEHLGADRVAYAEDQGDGETVLVTRNYTRNGGPGIEGLYRYEDFGPALAAELRAGHSAARPDIARDPTLTGAEKAAHAALQIGALAGVPLVKKGRLVAVLAVHYGAAHAFAPEEMALCEEVAERTWDAVERARAEARLRESEERLTKLAAASSDVLYRMSPDWGEVRELTSRGFVAPRAGPNRAWLMEYVLPEDRVRIAAAIDEAIQSRSAFELEHRVLHADRTVGWTASRAVPLFDERGELREWFGAAADITERKRAELNTAFLGRIGKDLAELSTPDEIMQAIGARVGEFLQVSGCLFSDVDEARGEVTVHHAWAAEGFPSLKQTFRIKDYLTEEFARAGSAGEIFVVRDTSRDERTDGRNYAQLRIGAFVVIPYRWGGRWTGYIAVTNVEPREWREDEVGLLGEVASRLFSRVERARAEQRLRESGERLRSALAIRTVGVVFWDGRGRIADANAAFLDMIGLTREEALGRTWQELTPTEFQPVSHRAIEELASRGETVPFEKQYYRRDGSRWWGLFTARKVGGETVEFVLDVTGRKEAERERERLLAMLGQSQTMVCDWAGRIEVWSHGMERLFGFAQAEAVGAVAWELLASEYPEPWPEIVAELRRAGRWQGEVRHRARDGSRRDVFATWTVQPGLDGAPSSLVVAEEDQTAVKEAEAALRALNEELERRVEERTGELMAAEDALRQAQKMEAVGQLTGGIAHDFNNMLQAIAGSLELLRRRLEQGRAAEAARFAEGAQQTVERAAGLTHRLLAFARRQALDPKPVEPDRLVEGMAELIRRTVGPGVAVELRTGGGVWCVLCDEGQLESALLNLAINARDAMPGGGRLTIGTEDVRLTPADVSGQDGVAPGDYVEVSVADTGAGMDAATVARAFEPFFTTKPLGQGTGLGLSQVYGFVRQSGGVVRLDSAPGRGTTVRLYLPRCEPAAAWADGEGAAEGARGEAGAGEAVLLVEDEAAVRAVAAEHLRELGYRVLEAGDGAEAVRLLRSAEGARVDVLVTDVGLPGGLNGRQVADIAREGRPGLPVLFITGYAGAALDGRLAPGMEVVAKPFALDALAARIRGMVAEADRVGDG